MIGLQRRFEINRSKNVILNGGTCANIPSARSWRRTFSGLSLPRLVMVPCVRQTIERLYRTEKELFEPTTRPSRRASRRSFFDRRYKRTRWLSSQCRLGDPSGLTFKQPCALQFGRFYLVGRPSHVRVRMTTTTQFAVSSCRVRQRTSYS